MPDDKITRNGGAHETAGVNQVFAEVERLAASVEHDEHQIMDHLIDALDKGQTAHALQVLKEWRNNPPRTVVQKLMESTLDANGE